MAAATTDKITNTRNSARPVTTTVSSARSAGGTTLACASLTGWPTASKVHFVTYEIDSTSTPVSGTQLDCYGIVSGNDITSFTVVDGTDAGNAIGDVVEMLPTAAWGQDLAEALTEEHSRTGTHTDVTADSIVIADAGTLDVDTISEATTANGVTIDGLNIKDSALTTAASVPSETLNATIASRAYRNSAFTISTTDTKVTLDTENYDLGSDFASGTFTAPTTGYYQVNANLAASNIGDGEALIARIYVNGAVYSLATGVGSAAGSDPRINISDLVPLTAGQTVELWAEGSTTITGGTGSSTTFMSIYFVGV